MTRCHILHDDVLKNGIQNGALLDMIVFLLDFLLFRPWHCVQASMGSSSDLSRVVGEFYAATLLQHETCWLDVTTDNTVIFLDSVVGRSRLFLCRFWNTGCRNDKCDGFHPDIAECLF